MEEAGKGDIVVQMSMYSDNEQVGSLGKSYTKKDEQITTHSGDIVLYSGDKIVVFYGSNSWAYTRLGKMNIPEGDVTELLSNGDITLKRGWKKPNGMFPKQRTVCRSFVKSVLLSQ